MSIIEGIGDEVTWFAVVTLLLIILLSVSYISSSVGTQSANSLHLSVNSPNGDLYGAVNSPASEDNQAGHDGNSTFAAFTNNNNNVVSRVETDRIDELNSCSENDSDIVVVDSCSEKVPTECDNIATATASEPSHDESLQQHSSSVVVQRTLTVDGSSNSDATDTNHSVRNDTSAPSATPTAPETEQSYSDQIVVRIKYLNDSERTVSTRLSKPIADFKRDHFSEELAANKIVRLIFNGQLLRNEVTLERCGISDGCVIHVHISQSDPHRPPSTMESNVDLDLSHILWPLLFVMLVIFWILYFKYPQFFNRTSTGILLIFTGGFTFVYNRFQART